MINLNRTTPTYLLFKSYAYLALGEFFNAFKTVLKAMLLDGKNLCISSQIFLLTSAIFALLEEKLNTELYLFGREKEAHFAYKKAIELGYEE